MKTFLAIEGKEIKIRGGLEEDSKKINCWEHKLFHKHRIFRSVV